ncbi:hypothetical protein YW7DRAFT_02609 [Streptomyces sp. AmelKG-E11A]|nr:hypothetical protein YW7DRAFT_02609 [Streptomyces sp. AmelKG-E11A]
MSGENVATQREESQLRVGELVFDTSRGVLGVVMDLITGTGSGRCCLRPPRGGVEWDASCADVRPATVTDQLRPALTEVNTRSRVERMWG